MAYGWFGLVALSVVSASVVRSGVIIADEIDIALPLLLFLGAVSYGRLYVLYLRLFGIDVRLRQVPGRFLQRGTEEEQLAQALDRIGPALPLAGRGGALPELGAARLYLDDAAWRNEVMQLMDDAALGVVAWQPPPIAVSRPLLLAAVVALFVAPLLITWLGAGN